MMGRLLQWFFQAILERLQLLESKIMASIEQLQVETSNLTAANAELKQTSASEKQEVAARLDSLEAKITQQTGLIEQLKAQAQGVIPDTILNELADVTAGIKGTTGEIRDIITPDTPVTPDAPTTPVTPVVSATPDASVTPIIPDVSGAPMPPITSL